MSVRAPNLANHPTSITLPDDGDPKPVASVNVALAALEDMVGQVARPVALVDIPGLTAGGLVLVSGVGLWLYTPATPFVADGFWVITSTAMGGQWISQYTALSNLGKIGTVGPVPGETFPTPTAVGRINKSLINQGWFANDGDDTRHTYPTSSTSIVTLVDLCNLGNTLDGGCIIHFSANATVVLTAGAPANFNVSTEISLDDAASWTAVTGNLGTLDCAGPSANVAYPVALGFMKITSPAPTGNVKIRLRGFLRTAGTMTLNVESWEAWVTRA